MRSYIFNFSTAKIEKLGIKGVPVLILAFMDQFFKSGNAETKEQDGKIFYWIEASKIIEDLPFLDIKPQMVRVYLDQLRDKGIIQDFDNNGKHYTKRFVHINYSMLVDQSDGEFTEVIGNDSTLPFYTPPGTNYYNTIKYNAFNFIYETPAIQSLIIEVDKPKFTKLLKAYLQKLLTPAIYAALIKNLSISTGQSTIKLKFSSTQTIMDSIVYVLESAVVGAYTSLLISQLLSKSTSKSTPNEVKNKPILNQISL